MTCGNTDGCCAPTSQPSGVPWGGGVVGQSAVAPEPDGVTAEALAEAIVGAVDAPGPEQAVRTATAAHRSTARMAGVMAEGSPGEQLMAAGGPPLECPVRSVPAPQETT